MANASCQSDIRSLDDFQTAGLYYYSDGFRTYGSMMDPYREAVLSATMFEIGSLWGCVSHEDVSPAG